MNRTRLGAAALLTAPGLVLAAHLVQATPARHDTASELAGIAAHQARYQLSAALGFVAMVLYVPALLAMARPLQGRPRTAAVGLTLSFTGLLSLVSLMGSGPVSLAMVTGGRREEMVALTDRYESLPLVSAWVLLMILGWMLGPIVLGVGLWRSGWSWAVPALLVGGLVLGMLDAGRWALALGFALTWAGMAVAGVGLLRAGAPEPDDAGERHDRAGVAA